MSKAGKQSSHLHGPIHEVLSIDRISEIFQWHCLSIRMLLRSFLDHEIIKHIYTKERAVWVIHPIRCRKKMTLWFRRICAVSCTCKWICKAQHKQLQNIYHSKWCQPDTIFSSWTSSHKFNLYFDSLFLQELQNNRTKSMHWCNHAMVEVKWFKCLNCADNAYPNHPRQSLRKVVGRKKIGSGCSLREWVAPLLDLTTAVWLAMQAAPVPSNFPPTDAPSGRRWCGSTKSGSWQKL